MITVGRDQQQKGLALQAPSFGLEPRQAFQFIGMSSTFVELQRVNMVSGLSMPLHQCFCYPANLVNCKSFASKITKNTDPTTRKLLQWYFGPMFASQLCCPAAVL